MYMLNINLSQPEMLTPPSEEFSVQNINILKPAACSGPCIEWSSLQLSAISTLQPLPKACSEKQYFTSLRVKQGPESSVYRWGNGKLERFSEAPDFQTEKELFRAGMCPQPPTTLLWWDSSVFQKEMKPRFKKCELQMLAIFVLKKNFRKRQHSISKPPFPDSGTKGCFGHWRVS